MAATAHIMPDSLADRFSRQIDLVQECFRKVSASATPADLANQFAAGIKGAFPGISVDLFQRAYDSDRWERLVDGGRNGESSEGIKQLDRLTVPFSYQNSDDGIVVLQSLFDDSCLGLVLTRPAGRGQSPDVEIASVRLLVNQFDNAYQQLLGRQKEKDLIFSLNHRVLQLNSLIDTGIEVAKLTEKASPERLALERATSLTNASRGVLKVKISDQAEWELNFPGEIAPRTRVKKEQRIKSSFRFDERTYTFELFEKESRKGIVPFDETDQLLLDALARQVHASLENRYLHEQALEKQKFEQDMAVAGSIQKRIIPAKLPQIEGYDIAGINIPSKSVGGDYYDCIPLADGRYALVIADVAGKGVQAGLLVSSLHAYLGAYLEGGMPLDKLADRLNKSIYRASPDDKFITAFIALLSPESGELELVNAGHNPVYLLMNDGTIREFGAAGLPLGMLDAGLSYQCERASLGRGERLLLYTDGIPEATNDKDEFYEVHSPLVKFLLRNRPDRAEQFIGDLIHDIKSFTGAAPQSDDITALYLHRIP